MGDTSTSYLTSIGDFAAKAAPVVTAGATVAAATLPFFLQPDAPSAPEFQGSTAQNIQADAAQKANQRRRELARRRGQAATIRTPLGEPLDLNVRREGIAGF